METFACIHSICLAKAVFSQWCFFYSPLSGITCFTTDPIPLNTSKYRYVTMLEIKDDRVPLYKIISENCFHSKVDYFPRTACAMHDTNLISLTLSVRRPRTDINAGKGFINRHPNSKQETSPTGSRSNTGKHVCQRQRLIMWSRKQTLDPETETTAWQHGGHSRNAPQKRKLKQGDKHTQHKLNNTGDSVVLRVQGSAGICSPQRPCL